MLSSHKKENTQDSEPLECEDHQEFHDVFERFQEASYVCNTDVSGAKDTNTPSGSGTPEESKQNEEVDCEPLEREELPWLKDPNSRVGILAVLKDSIGVGDLSKMSVPVYFNDPTSILQKQAMGMEYYQLLDQAADEPDPLRRIALLAVHQVSALSVCERACSKPFNPLLGETFEFTNDSFQFLAEQVSHHPPVTAVYCRGKKYTFSTCHKMNTSFNGKMLKVTSQYRQYCHFDDCDETYELKLPVLSAHNLVIGQMYVDIGESMVVTNLKRPNERCEVKFERRGWFTGDSFKFSGEVLSGPKQVAFLIEGNWNDQARLVDPKTSEKKVVWKKSPYPAKWEYMYGMAKFHIQMNYLPKRLDKVVAPTDTRRRQDQRALENGDMKLAAQEKDRLENRQRTYRKYYEATGQKFEPRYFTPYHNDQDGQEYWKYNGKYFEEDRAKQDWSRCPKIFDYDFPSEVAPFKVG
jgi:oxysterol-binding protein 1